MLTIPPVVSASIPPVFEFSFDFGPFFLVVLAVLVVGILGTLLSVRAADRQTSEKGKPYVSLHLRPGLRT